MIPQIASGTAYNAGSVGSGIAPVYTGTEDVYSQTMGAFNDAYSSTRQWQKDKEAEAAAKAKKLNDLLGGLDFKTAGIMGSDTDYFLKAKDAHVGWYSAQLGKGVNPNNSSFVNEYRQHQQAIKGINVLVDHSIEDNKKLLEARKELAAKPNEYDYEQSVGNIKKFYETPIEKRVEGGYDNLLVPKKFDTNKFLTDQYKPGGALAHPDATSYVDGSGMIHKVKEFGQQDPNLVVPAENPNDPIKYPFDTSKGLRPDLIRGTQFLMASKPDFHDDIMKKFTALPDAVQESYKKIAKAYTNKMGVPMLAEDWYAYNISEPYAYKEDTADKYDPYTDAYKRTKGKHDADDKHDKNLMVADMARDAQIYIGSPAAYYKGDDGLKHLSKPWSVPINTYTEVLTEKGQTKTVKVPAIVTDIIHSGVTNEDNRPLIRIQDSYSVNHPNDKKLGTDANGYYVMDANELLTNKRHAQYGKDAIKADNAWIDFNKAHGAWDNGVVNAKAPGLSVLDPAGYASINQKDAITEAEAAQNGPQEERNLTINEKAARAQPKSSLIPLNKEEKKKTDWTKYKRQ